MIKITLTFTIILLLNGCTQQPNIMNPNPFATEYTKHLQKQSDNLKDK